jgi:DNA-binding IclR family transcriptional regulator
MTQRKRGAALDKALTILDEIVRQRRPVGLAYLAEELELTKPTIHRVLLQLEEAGLIQRSPDKDRYWIGPKLNTLSAKALGSLNQPYPTRMILQALVDELGETCNVGVLDQHEVHYIDRVESHFPLRFDLRAGSRVPAHCTAIGKLLLAYRPREVRRQLFAAAPLTGFTDNTIVDEERFEWELTRIRQQGYSANNEEYILGLIAVAVPIFDSDGHAIAAVAVHAPVARLTLRQAISTIPTLQSAAEKFATSWGLRDRQTPAQAVEPDKTEEPDTIRARHLT